MLHEYQSHCPPQYRPHLAVTTTPSTSGNPSRVALQAAGEKQQHSDDNLVHTIEQRFCSDTRVSHQRYNYSRHHQSAGKSATERTTATNPTTSRAILETRSSVDFMEKTRGERGPVTQSRTRATPDGISHCSSRAGRQTRKGWQC